MGAKQLGTKIDENIKDSLDAFCKTNGIKIGRFVEDAILDKLEEHIDISELEKIRKEKFKPFSKVLKDLKV